VIKSPKTDSQTRQKRLYRVTIHTSLEAEDAVVEMLTNAFGVAPAIFSPESTRSSLVSVFTHSFPDRLIASKDLVGAAGFTSKQLLSIKRQLQAWLEDIKAAGLDIGPSSVSIRTLRPQDWAESWKHHFKALNIGDQLLIKPSWSRKKPRSSQRLMIMDPGLSFGTGQHPTTAYCLAQIVQNAQANTVSGFLDIGTGSGILAIAAAKMGFNPIAAIDNDADAIGKALENAETNAVISHITFSCCDLSAWKPPQKRFDLVCANLQSDLLISQAKLIRRTVANHGQLVLAGILASQFNDVQKKYSQLGLIPVRSEISGEWQSGVFAGPTSDRNRR
jgi:ribosomal protein L11 methyltransferase